MKKRTTNPKRKKKILLIFGTILLLLLVFFLIFWNRTQENLPVLTIETPHKISLSQSGEFSLDVTISDFGDALYPAASMSISFDPSYLEFLEVEEGNVFTDNQEDGISKKLPEWSYNKTQCNDSGKIQIMYLDTTAGKNAFRREFLEKEDNVVLRLKFRLRGSVRKGDVYDLIFEDAIFAASDEKESLAMTRDTLKVRNGKIVIGE